MDLQEDQKTDFSLLLALFGEQKDLELYDGLRLSEEAGRLLEQMIDRALSDTLAPLPKGEALELVNREDALCGRLPCVSLDVEERGVLSLGAVHLRRLSFEEVVEHLAQPAEAFELFLYDRQVSNWRGYLRNLFLWKRVTPALVLDFRKWMAKFSDLGDPAANLQAVALYCRLAEAAGHLSVDELEAVLAAIEKPLPARRRRANAGDRPIKMTVVKRHK